MHTFNLVSKKMLKVIDHHDEPNQICFYYCIVFFFFFFFKIKREKLDLFK